MRVDNEWSEREVQRVMDDGVNVALWIAGKPVGDGSPLATEEAVKGALTRLSNSRIALGDQAFGVVTFQVLSADTKRVSESLKSWAIRNYQGHHNDGLSFEKERIQQPCIIGDGVCWILKTAPDLLGLTLWQESQAAKTEERINANNAAILTWLHKNEPA